jgi:hypothetical protein
MIKIIYPNIVIETITDKVTINNYGKQDYVVFDTNGDYLFTMYHQFMTLPIAEGLCSGDMKKCNTAISTYLKNEKYHTIVINNFLNNL